jgi:hypothetical protein
VRYDVTNPFSFPYPYEDLGYVDEAENVDDGEDEQAGITG